MSDKVYQRFEQVLQQLSLRPQQQIVIALGGGADSQTVLDCAMRFRQSHPQYRYLAVHLDHSFHPDSGDWSNTIEQAVQAYQVDTLFEPLPIDIGKRQSKEAAGRERRYQRLQEISDDDAVILLGQHRNDQIETLLLQLNRGSGPKGLAAMAEIHQWHGNRQLVRPLLAISKAEIYQYAEAHQLTWIEDDTNYDTRIERNFLRHDVVPKLEQRWPQFGDSVLRSAQLCAEQQQVLEQLLNDQLRPQLVHEDVLGEGFPVDILRQKNDATQRAMLRRWIETNLSANLSLPSYHQLEQIRQQALDVRADARLTVNCHGYDVRFYQMALWVVCLPEPTLLDEAVTQAGTITLPAPWGRLNVNAELLARGTLRLVNQAPSGKLRHIKRQGRKAARDWFKQAQFAPWLRSSVPLLSFDEQWFWAPRVGWLTTEAEATPELTALLFDNPPIWLAPATLTQVSLA